MLDEILSLERCYVTPPGIALGPLAQVPDGGARGFVLRIAATRFHGFVVRRGAIVHGYVDRCPHAGLPLARQLDAYLTPAGDLIACGWHGALFSIEDGRCVGGPCSGQMLARWPIEVRDGAIVTTGGERAGS